MNKTNRYVDITAEVVMAALSGSDEGYATLLNYYEPYISKLSLMHAKDATGNYAYSFVDEDLKQLMRIGIIKAAQMFSKKLH